MQDNHTLRRLLSESDDGEVKHPRVAREWADALFSSALSHPRNSQIMRDWDFSLKSLVVNNPPARKIAEDVYAEYADRLSLSLPDNDTSHVQYLTGFPVFTFTLTDPESISSPEALALCSRTARKCGLPTERANKHAVFVTLWSGEIWLPVLSHPRGDETHIDWTDHALSSLPTIFMNRLTALRSETKDIPLCKSLECYSMSLTARAVALPARISLSTDGLPKVTGSTLKRIPVDYLYQCKNTR